jgi:REP element-mobilizing transposase RayT
VDKAPDPFFLLDRYRHRYDLRIHHFCLMSNHFHLLLQLHRCQHLSTLLAGLLRSYE